MLTIKFSNIYINEWFTIAGDDERQGLLKNIDLFIKDFYYGEKTLEDAEIKMQRTALNNILAKNAIDFVIGGDLSNQLGTMNKAMSQYTKSFLGIYNACSTYVEGLILAATLIQNNRNLQGCVLTSSHNLTSERQFRYPVEYGGLKACYTTSTITASIATSLSSKVSPYRIHYATIGSVVDLGINDVYNMGGVMAPAACAVIKAHLDNLHKSITDYDLILTGDLGSVGLNILKELLEKEYEITPTNIKDAGTMIYHKKQKKYTGGSGPTVLPIVLLNKIFKEKKYQHILIVGTGALHNPTLVNQKKSIPAIAHLVEIEVL